jgi:hypothetical protein
MTGDLSACVADASASTRDGSARNVIDDLSRPSLCLKWRDYNAIDDSRPSVYAAHVPFCNISFLISWLQSEATETRAATAKRELLAIHMSQQPSWGTDCRLAG